MIHLRLEHICKAFPGVKALDGVGFEVVPGEIHALCGENGAGKSTLMNILAGNLQPDSGRIMINGESINLGSPQDAFSHGIAIVYQHLSLADNLSVAENIYTDQYPKNHFGFIEWDKLYIRTKALLQELQLENIDPRALVGKLSPAQKQMVEIAKALNKKPAIFILDEPTASLTGNEVTTLFTILWKLKKNGTSIIYISHRMEEIFSLADKISILKDGIYQGTFLTEELSKEKLIAKMVGRNIENLNTESYVTKNILLSVKSLSGKRFKDITFNLMGGEILGVAGLVGAGRTEIARAIFGADPYDAGEIFLRAERLKQGHPCNSITKGIAYVPEDRTTNSLFLEMSVQDNIISSNLSKTLNKGIYSPRKAKAMALESKEKLRITTPSVSQKVIHLSGGNQQKVVLARWLQMLPEVLIVDEPTHGIDIGAKFEIYNILRMLASEGKGILMISSDLPELLGISDRIMVIKKGHLASIVPRKAATEETILALASN